MSEKLKVQVLEGADNKLDLAKLEDILKRKLIIPSYQRPYSWKTEDIKEIFETIKTARENEENLYFFGSIILSQKSNATYGQEEYYIIDGQQRLSSFLLILKVILIELKHLLKELEGKGNQSKEQIKKETELESKKEELSKIIDTVSLTREQSDDSEEKSILHFIKKGKDYENLPDHLDKKIKEIYEHSIVPFQKEWPDPADEKFLNKYIDETLSFLDQILNQIKFCLINITGQNSEDFAINLFNTLNTTGQPLTAFEVLKSELYKIDPKLSKTIDEIQKDIIKKYTFQRKKIISHTGKLLLYLPLYRGDFKEDSYTLSDRKFKDQRGYLKEVLDSKTASQLVEDIKTVDEFYSQFWLDPDSIKKLLKKDDERVCFHFLSELTHDRVLPIMIRFHKNQRESLGKCVKVCTAFSSLWRAFSDGGTSGVDKAYKDISLDLKEDHSIENLNKKLKELFLKKLSSKPSSSINIEEAKDTWLKKLKISTVYKNQKLSKFLLFIAYNKLHFNSNTKLLQKSKGIDILKLHYWKDEDYKTIEHIIPKTNRTFFSHIHTLGNLTLLPQKLNSSVGDKPFSEKLKQYKKFCSTENEDKYPYLPLIKHIAHCNQFKQEEIEDRSKILSEFVWKTLAEDWLGWRE